MLGAFSIIHQSHRQLHSVPCRERLISSRIWSFCFVVACAITIEQKSVFKTEILAVFVLVVAVAAAAAAAAALQFILFFYFYAVPL